MPNESPPLSAAEVARIARLAHLDLSADELTRMARELGQILGYVRKLGEVDIDQVAPTAHVQLERLELRDDEPEESLPSELALREAPSVSQGGFSVPAFVDEG
jgi:aspartyl-tRNA(Asn)/glutamyl-tRNA(Gln) amidotransferase subunit C